MSRAILTPRQWAIRKSLIKAHGMISNQELADIHNVCRTTVWKDRMIIAEVKPITDRPYDEDAEIKSALAHFEDISTQLMDELQQNDIQVETFGHTLAVVSFLNVRVNLLGQVRQNQTDRRNFLLEIGYLKATAKEFSLTTPLHKMTDQEIMKEIDETNAKLALIKGPLDGDQGENNSSGSPVDETQTLSLPAEDDDRIQGS